MGNRIKSITGIVVKQWWVIVIITMLASFALSLLMGLGQSIWFDEGYSILLAKQSVIDLIALTNVDAHPPLYYILLKGWTGLFGWSELALRSLSAFLTAGAAGIALLLVRQLFSVKTMLLTAPLLVIAPFLLRYGYEVRMYALATLIGIAATYVLVRANRSSDKRLWITYGVLVAFGMYTLYMTLVIWLAHVVWLLFTVKPKRLLRYAALYGYGTAIVLFLPQLPVFIHQTLHSALPGVGTEVTLTKLVSVFGIMTIYAPEWQIDGWLSVLLIAAVVLFGIVFARVIKNRTYRSGLLLLGALVIVPLLFYIVTSLPPRKPIFIERYMAHVAVYFYLFVAVTAVLGLTLRQKLIPVLYVAILGAVLVIGSVRLYDTGNLNLERMQYPETRQLRSSIPCDQSTTIVADDPYTYIDSFYYFDSCNLVFFSEKQLAFQGGYAPLAKSDKRIDSPNDVSTNRLVHIYWDGATPTFVPDSPYSLTETHVFGKQKVTIYER